MREVWGLVVAGRETDRAQVLCKRSTLTVACALLLCVSLSSSPAVSRRLPISVSALSSHRPHLTLPLVSPSHHLARSSFAAASRIARTCTSPACVVAPGGDGAVLSPLLHVRIRVSDLTMGCQGETRRSSARHQRSDHLISTRTNHPISPRHSAIRVYLRSPHPAPSSPLQPLPIRHLLHSGLLSAATQRRGKRRQRRQRTGRARRWDGAAPFSTAQPVAHWCGPADRVLPFRRRRQQRGRCSVGCNPARVHIGCGCCCALSQVCCCGCASAARA